MTGEELHHVGRPVAAAPPAPGTPAVPACGRGPGRPRQAHLRRHGDGDITDAVSEIIWTGGKIDPRNYQDFTVAFGQLLTGASQLAFKALQTYSDGKIVRWIEAKRPGQPEPENPAPTLKLTAAAPDDAPTAAPKTPTAAPANAHDSTARNLGIAGLAVGVLGLARSRAGKQERGA
ncbi:DUF1775 domain-containing protein [Streptomyces sp. RGM 3693]|uniref:DUF1775 domain-containing protein n=1 Tax=Streptomyces sp. RGM 3693 TaxID=3413284 RepID=UPI003D27DC46